MTKRDAIIGLYCAGTPISKIKKQLKIPKSTVYDAVRRYKELAIQKIVPKADVPTHAIQKATSKPFKRG